MKTASRIFAVLLFIGSLFFIGCESRWGSAGLGAAGGAAAGAGGYEYHLNQEKDRVEELYEEGKIDQEEYQIRMDQIQRDSVLQ